MSNKSNKIKYLRTTLFSIGLLVIGYLAGNLISYTKDTECETVKANVLNADQTTETVDNLNNGTNTQKGSESTTENNSDAQNKDSTTTSETQKDTSNSNTVATENSGPVTYVLGQESAPVTIIEYTDYQCPYCQRYFLTTFEKLQKTYIKEGKVKYIVKNLPLDFHTLSKPAVYTVKCSGEQGKYWEMHAKIFTYQSGWAYSDDPYQEFITYADDLGLNLEKFTTCMKTGPQKYDKQINNNILEATSLGLSGTPSFVINGQILIGAQPLSAFTQIIDEELKKK